MRRFYKEMLIATLAAGILSFFGCRLLLGLREERIWQPVLVGLCFGLTALLSQLFAALTDRLCQRIGEGVHRDLMVKSFGERARMLLFILLFTLAVAVAGGVLQLLYQLDPKNAKPSPPEQFVILIDNSGSMQQNDPNDERFAVTEKLLDNLTGDNAVAILGFTDTPEELHPLLPVSQEPLDRDRLHRNSYGGTNVDAACREAIRLAKQSGSRSRTRILLLTDGACGVLSGHPKRQRDLVGKLVKAGCEVFAIGFGQPDEASLQYLSTETGGAYFYVSDLSRLWDAVEEASSREAVTAARRLTGIRSDRYAGSVLYGLFRILAIACLGVLIALFSGLSLAFQSQMRPIMLQGIVKSLAAGVLTELLCALSWEKPAQLCLWILLSVLCLFYTPTASALSGGSEGSPESGSGDRGKPAKKEDPGSARTVTGPAEHTGEEKRHGI